MGKEGYQAGFISFVVALVLLMIYMCMMYGLLPGLVVDAALLLQLLHSPSVYWHRFQAVLTLAGIAGMVLTLGMAVDANVLIFERIKEELALSRNW